MGQRQSTQLIAIVDLQAPEGVHTTHGMSVVMCEVVVRFDEVLTCEHANDIIGQVGHRQRAQAHRTEQAAECGPGRFQQLNILVIKHIMQYNV